MLTVTSWLRGDTLPQQNIIKSNWAILQKDHTPGSVGLILGMQEMIKLA